MDFLGTKEAPAGSVEETSKIQRETARLLRAVEKYPGIRRAPFGEP
jgi:hypothetical protein